MTTGKYLTLVNQAEYVANLGLTPVWDEETSQNYLEWRDGPTLYQVWLEDAESLEAKLSVMDAHGCAGVAEWKLGLETREAWDTILNYMGI